MLDIHVIPNPGFDENLARMKDALEQPLVTLHEAPYVPGNILAARLQGFALGTQPYVSWVDGDDRVLGASWIPRAIELLDRNPEVSAVYPRWCVSGAKKPYETPRQAWTPEMHAEFGKRLPFAHHLTVMRREQVLSLLSEAEEAVQVLIKCTERFLVSGIVRFGPLVSFDNLAYEWCLRPGTARTMQDTPGALKWLRKRWAQDARIAKSVPESEV